MDPEAREAINRSWNEWFAVGYLRKVLPPDFPLIVTLCVSTRFMEEYEAEAKRLTGEGVIVLSVGRYGHRDGLDMAGDLKERLDVLHLRKIDLSDEIFVINPGGYVGDSTRREIAHAVAHGKPVRYLEPPA